MIVLAIKVSREDVTFEVSHPSGKLTSEAALAMAEMHTRWGYQGSNEDLRSEHVRIIKRSTVLANSANRPETNSDIDAMLEASNKIAFLEELASILRETRDDPEHGNPQFEETDDCKTLLEDYAVTLGCTVEVL